VSAGLSGRLPVTAPKTAEIVEAVMVSPRPALTRRQEARSSAGPRNAARIVIDRASRIAPCSAKPSAVSPDQFAARPPRCAAVIAAAAAAPASGTRRDDVAFGTWDTTPPLSGRGLQSFFWPARRPNVVDSTEKW
jgi:hypothetical protein